MPLSSYWWVPLVAGLQDAVNPCILITSVFFIVFAGWIARQPLGKGRYLQAFVLVYYILSVFLNLGLAQGLLYSPMARQLIHAVYVFLGFVSLGAGLVFLNDWRLLSLQKQDRLLSRRLWQASRMPPWAAWALLLAAVIMLAAFATIWPMNVYMGIMSNNVFLDGQFWPATGALAVYTASACSMLFLTWTAFLLLSKDSGLFYAIAAGISCSAGVSAIIFYGDTILNSV